MFKKLFKLFKENAVAYAAVFISLLALFVSITQTRILSQEKHASVWPYLQVGDSWHENAGNYSLAAKNAGVGPAIIQNVEFHYQDTIFVRIQDFAKYIMKKEGLGGRYSYVSIEHTGYVLQEGESRTILEIKGDTLAAEAALKHRRNLEIIIDYCSVYGKCWQLKDFSTQKTKKKSEFKNLIY